MAQNETQRRARQAQAREARPQDVPAIVGLIRDLADYERAVDEAKATEEQLHEALFGPNPAVFALVIDGDGGGGASNGELDGLAIWFRNFSTWTGRHGIYLEDLYVRPEARGRGYGGALLRALAAICVERGYTRLEWSVLDWNEPAIGFYRSLGAVPNDGWTVFRLAGASLESLGARVDRTVG
jgi:GNAT superfamily N-acetyltransferase